MMIIIIMARSDQL